VLVNTEVFCRSVEPSGIVRQVRPQVLVVDDEVLIRQSLHAVLVEEGFTVGAADSAAEAWRAFERDRPDVVLLDLVLGDGDGLDLLRRMKELVPASKVVVISAHGSFEHAVGAMKLGAYDFIKKPFELEEVVATVRNAARTSTLEHRVAYLSDQDRRRSGSHLIQESAAMRDLVKQITIVATNPVPLLLLLGETGTGKQVLARHFHDCAGRVGGPLVELNCSAIPEALIESELFGHERGAFSDARERKLGLVEVADGGTLFLDEVGDLGPAAQAKLLTFLEQRTFRRVGATATRSVDVRIVAATNRDLRDMVAHRTFREDLWYRLGAIALRVPPLRERADDVASLAQSFLADASRQYRRRWRGIADEALRLLRGYPWPGNVRELRSVMNRAALLHDDDILRPVHLPPEIGAAVLAQPATAEAAGTDPLATVPTLEAVELNHIRRVLDLCGGNRTLAAQYLDITRQTLARKLGGGDS
jgi:two-component system, NtrC family, response regulator AtoC